MESFGQFVSSLGSVSSCLGTILSHFVEVSNQFGCIFRNWLSWFFFLAILTNFIILNEFGQFLTNLGRVSGYFGHLEVILFESNRQFFV